MKKTEIFVIILFSFIIFMSIMIFNAVINIKDTERIDSTYSGCNDTIIYQRD